MAKKKRATPPPPAKRKEVDSLVSIIIPVYNRLDATRFCIEAIKSCTPEGVYELILVDNGSTDGTPEYLAGAGVQTIRFEENRGVATAWNAGIREARGRFLIFLHNDVLVSPGWLGAITAPFKDRSVFCVSLPHTLFGLNPEFAEWSEITAEIPPAFWDGGISSFCFALSKNAVHRIGEFDEALSLGPYVEHDLMFRMETAGLRTVVANNGLVHHFGGQTATHVPEFYGVNDRRNWEHLSGKWHLRPMPSMTEDPDFLKRLDMMRETELSDRLPDYAAPRTEQEETPEPRIVACISFFNEIELLPGCIESLEGVDEIVLVDGVYAAYPSEYPWSTDGTLEWIKERQKTDKRIRLIECTAPWADEGEKRSAYFAGRDGDWYLIIDADERLRGENRDVLGDLRKHIAGYGFDTIDLSVGAGAVSIGQEKHVRLLRHLPGLRYEATHFNIVSDDKMLFVDSVLQGNVTHYSGCWIEHLVNDRPQARSERKLEYYYALVAYEIEKLKSAIISRWDDPAKEREYFAYIAMYSHRLSLLRSLNEAKMESVALDSKYLPKTVPSRYFQLFTG